MYDEIQDKVDETQDNAGLGNKIMQVGKQENV